MRLVLCILVFVVLFAIATAAHSQVYVVQCRLVGTTDWLNAPQEFIYNPGPWPPPWPPLSYQLYTVRQEANQARETGKLNHPDYEWRVWLP